MAPVSHGVITALSSPVLSQRFGFYVSGSRVTGGTSIAYRIHPALEMEKFGRAGLESPPPVAVSTHSLAYRLVNESSDAPFLAPTDSKPSSSCSIQSSIWLGRGGVELS